ncbi:MAG: GNAT family N-acetyltransferase [Proteobacteria bacterium]|nr:GNAT family N-acetyltransferase [Pseudomonadota bacterium]
MSQYNLDKILKPGAVAVVGATDRPFSVGRAVVHNLQTGGFHGPIYPINPRRDEILGLKALPSLGAIGRPTDLAVICTAIETVPGIIEECAAAGIGGAVILSAGGKEIGARGQAIEDEITRAARQARIRLIGPNCVGIASSAVGMNASFVHSMPLPGNLAFVAQSGAVCSIVLDYAIQEHIGFSHFIAIGSMIDVDFGDLIDYFGNDPEVGSILLYIEGVTNPRKFLSAARAVSRVKPIVVLKSGRSSAGAKAAQSHTGSLAGEDSVYDAAFKRAGIVRVNMLEDLFGCAELMAKQTPPNGSNLAIVTLAGGLGVMVADYLADYGLEPAELRPETFKKIDEQCPSIWSHANPIDMTGMATLEGFRNVISICAEAEEIDAQVIISVPNGLFSSEVFAGSVAETIQKARRPAFVVMPGGEEMEAGRDILNKAGLPTYASPEAAVRAFHYMYTYSRNLRMLQEVPRELASPIRFDREEARRLVDQIMGEGRGLMTEFESKRLLASYGIPTNQTELAETVVEAVVLARQMGYPVAAKVNSLTVTHKSDAGGIRLDLRNSDDVIDAFEQIEQSVAAYDPQAHFGGVTIQRMVQDKGYEVIIGSKHDSDFGPVILFGMGGVMTELIGDRSIGLPPLNRLLARRMIEETRVYRLLKGFRGRPPANLDLLEEILVRLSQLVMDFPEISELDVNPLLLTAADAYALDARVVLKPSARPAPWHMAISAYPAEYENRFKTRNGHDLFIRPIRPEDAPLLSGFFNSLSEETVYLRFLRHMKVLDQDTLARYTQIDYDRDLALVAFDESVDRPVIVGVARYFGHPDGEEAEFAIVVGDDWQGQTVGAGLLALALQAAKRQGFKRAWGLALREANGMIEMAEKSGAVVTPVENGSKVKLSIDLSAI